jgi:hypothetical protein
VLHPFSQAIVVSRTIAQTPKTASIFPRKCSTYGMDSDVKESLAAGFAKHLTKLWI